MTEPTLTASEKRLLKAVYDTGQPTVMAHVDGRKPWRLQRGGPGWKVETFCALANRGYLRIEYGFAMRADVSLTDAGRAQAAGGAKAAS